MSRNLIHVGTPRGSGGRLLESANARAFVEGARNRLENDEILRASGNRARVCENRVLRRTLYLREINDRAKNIRLAGRSASLRMK